MNQESHASQSASGQPRRAIDLFGGVSKLADTLLKKIQDERPNEFIDIILSDKKPSELLKSMNRQAVLDMLWDCGIPINHFTNLIRWKDGDKEYWADKLLSTGSGVMYGAGGHTGDDDAALGVYVFLNALSDICSQQYPQPKKHPKLAALREKYAAILSR